MFNLLTNTIVRLVNEFINFIPSIFYNEFAFWGGNNLNVDSETKNRITLFYFQFEERVDDKKILLPNFKSINKASQVRHLLDINKTLINVLQLYS